MTGAPPASRVTSPLTSAAVFPHHLHRSCAGHVPCATGARAPRHHAVPEDGGVATLAPGLRPADGDGDADGNADGDADGNADGNADGDADADADGNADGDGDAPECVNDSETAQKEN